MPGVGIVHLGLGAFFRAHVAQYVSEAMAARGGDWRVIGISLRRPDIRDALAPQGFRYHAVERGPDGDTPRGIDVISDVLVAPEDPEAVIRALADPAIRLVTLTITEKGYCRDPATGALDRANPDIRHDIAVPSRPRSAPGFLVAALARRRALGLRPFTVLSCDNLPDNGAQTRAVTLALARVTDPALADWIEAEARFPSTMVDRIVPATTVDDIARLARDHGIADAAPVFHEPFRQWVIEDDFVDGARPAFEVAGATLVADVAPFEAMKLRCLNGAHTALACLGLLAGHETIADTVARSALRRVCSRPLARRDHPGRHPAAGRGSRRLCRRALRTLRQPRHPPPHLPDRHRHQPEAAAAPARHPGREPRRGPARATRSRSPSPPGSG